MSNFSSEDLTLENITYHTCTCCCLVPQKMTKRKLNLHKLPMSAVFVLLYLTPSYHSTPPLSAKQLLRHAESKVQFSLKPLPGLGSV